MHAFTAAALLGAAAVQINAQTDTGTSGAFSIPGFSADPVPTGIQLASVGSGADVPGSLQPTSDVFAPQVTDSALAAPTDTNPFPSNPGVVDGEAPIDSQPTDANAGVGQDSVENLPSDVTRETQAGVPVILEDAPTDTAPNELASVPISDGAFSTTPLALPAETPAPIPSISTSTVTEQVTVTVTPTPTGAITFTPSAAASTAGFLLPKPTPNGWGYYRTGRDIKGPEQCVGANIQIDSGAKFNLTATKAYNITNGYLGNYVWVMSFKESNGKKRDIYMGTQSGPGQASYLYFTCPTPKSTATTTTPTTTTTSTSSASEEDTATMSAGATTGALFRRQAPVDTSSPAPFTLDPSLTFPLPSDDPASNPTAPDLNSTPQIFEDPSIPAAGGLDPQISADLGGDAAANPSDSAFALPSNPLEPPGAEVSAINADPGAVPAPEQTQPADITPISLPAGTEIAEPLPPTTSSEISEVTPPVTSSTSESIPPALTTTTTKPTPTPTSTPTPTPTTAAEPAKDIPGCQVAGSDVMLNAVVTSSKDGAVEVFDTIISNKPWGFAKTAFTGKNAYEEADDGDCPKMSENSRPNFKNLRYTATGYYIPSLKANAASRQAQWVQDGGKKILKLSLGDMNKTDDHISTRFFNRTGYYLYQGGQCQWVAACGYDCFFSIYDRPYLQQMGTGKQAGIPGISESKANNRWMNMYLGNPTLEKVSVSYPGLVAFDRSQKWLTTQVVFSFAPAGGSDDVSVMHFDRVKKTTPKITEFALPKECAGAERFIKKS